MIEYTKRIVEKFVAWTKVKCKIHLSDEESLVYFHEREIWWCSIGMNVGYEQNGKNENFERPIVVLKKFNKHLLWALPVTSQPKSGKFYYQTPHQGKNYFIILSQLRAMSSKRLLRKIRTVPEDEFQDMRRQMHMFL